MTERRFKKKLEKIEKQGERYKQEKELKDAYSQYVPEKKKRKVSNIMLVIIVTAIVTYTVASFWLTRATGVSIDSTLTTCYYAFWVSELISLAGIKVSKVKNNYDNSYTSDDSQSEINDESDEDIGE